MTKATRVEFEIFGQKYAIRSEAAPDYVRDLVAHVNKVVRQVQAEGPRDPQKVAVLAALYITDELFQNRRTEGTAAERVGALVELLNKAASP